MNKSSDQSNAAILFMESRSLFVIYDKVDQYIKDGLLIIT